MRKDRKKEGYKEGKNVGHKQRKEGLEQQRGKMDWMEEWRTEKKEEGWKDRNIQESKKKECKEIMTQGMKEWKKEHNI